VNHECRFTSYEMGWSGSVPDMKIWKQSHLWTHRHQYFKHGRYVLVDKGNYYSSKWLHLFNNIAGYPSSPYAIRPFDERELAAASAADKIRMRKFNQRVSHIQIASEHTFGLLKARFPSLKEMGIHRRIQDMYKAIEPLMIIHNICIDWGDRPEDTWNIDSADSWSDSEEDDDDETVGGYIVGGEADVPPHKTENWLLEQGRQKCLILMNELFP
jgi:hypothetical protein